MRKFYFGIFLIIVGFNSFSQDNTIWLMNGKKVVIQEYKLTEDFESRVVAYTTLKGKHKLKDAQDIFSITSREGEEEVFYIKNLDAGNEFEVNEMRNFLNGKTELKKEHKAIWAGVGGFAAGYVGVMIPPISYSGSGGSGTIPWAPIIPVAYVLVVGNTTKTFSQIQKRYPDISPDEYYLMGTQKGIQEQRLKSSLIGTGIGILAGFITQRAL